MKFVCAVFTSSYQGTAPMRDIALQRVFNRPVWPWIANGRQIASLLSTLVDKTGLVRDVACSLLDESE